MEIAVGDPRQIVCIGACALDTILSVEQLPGRDERVPAGFGVLAGGGPAATAAVTIRRLGRDVAIAGVVGDDDAGALIRAGLASADVDVSLLRIVRDGTSALSVGLVNPVTGDRSLVSYGGSAPAIAVDDALEAACRNASWLHVDHAGYAVVADLRRRGVDTPISVDGGNPIADLDLSLVDLYVPSVAELSRQTGVTVLRDAMVRAFRAGPSVVIATAGADGSLGLSAGPSVEPLDRSRIQRGRDRDGDQEGWWHQEPAHPVELEDGSTLGAGDVYHGALVAMLAGGESLAGAMRDASIAAALSCRAVDGRSGIPGAAEIHQAARAQTPSGAVPR